jgi:hypothetical protein
VTSEKFLTLFLKRNDKILNLVSHEPNGSVHGEIDAKSKVQTPNQKYYVTSFTIPRKKNYSSTVMSNIGSRLRQGPRA